MLLCTNFHANICVFSSFGFMPMSGIVGLYGSLMFNFWETAKLFSVVATILYFQRQCMRVLIFPHPHQHLFVYFFDDRHSSENKVGAHWGFDTIFQTINKHWSLHVLIDNFSIFFEETSIQIICLLLNWVICLFVVGLWVVYNIRY